MNKKKKLEDLGYNDFFDSNYKAIKLDNFLIARVIAEHRGSYKVKGVNGEYLAKITGKQRFKASTREDYPAVGDWVATSKPDKGNAVILKTLPRMTMIKRKYGNKNKVNEKRKTQIIATNIDVAFIVESVDRDYSLNRLERYLTITKSGGAKPVIVINKIDLISKEELNKKLSEIKNRFINIDIIITSTVINKGVDQLKKYIIKGKTYCFLGSSGVGKSSLINKLLNKESIKTKGISSYSGRGQHTTTNREMYFLENGGIVIDNPGIREVGIISIKKDMDDLFSEITALASKCKYSDCTHTHEPGCQVLMAVKTGKLDKEKHLNYLSLKKESEYYEKNNFEQKKKEREFGKFIKKTKKELEKLKNK